MISSAWSKISLTFFFTIALLGTIMRLYPFTDTIIDYEHLLHAHSHVAFQGWIYTALFLLICKCYLTEDLIKKGKYRLQFYLTLATIIGIMLAFIIEGYAFFSILFSSLFQILNYWLTYRFFKDVKKSHLTKTHQFSLKFIKLGLLLMVLSTFGPWAVGVISAKGLAASEYFNAALYFFLHFQYNGWFAFAILGLFFWLLEHYKIPFNRKQAKLFFVLFSLAVIPTFALSLLGMSFRSSIIIFGYVGGALQLIALFYFMKAISASFQLIKNYISKIVLALLLFVLMVFITRILLQFISLFPFLEDLAFGNRYLIIAYIHLIMLGFMSFFTLAIFFQLSYLKENSTLVKTGVIALLLGFLGSEFILLALGISLPLFSNLLFLLIASAVMAIGILLVLVGQWKNKETHP